VFRKALAKPASDRYATCTDFVEALAAACALNPEWHPLARSGSQNMPTVAGAPPVDDVDSGRPIVPPLPQNPVAPVPAHRVRPVEDEPGHSQPIFSSESTEARTNPILKSLVWMLVGLGLVGLVLFGAQKYLFNRSVEAPVPVAEATRPSEPAVAQGAKPSPLGTSPQPTADNPSKAPPENTTPASSTPPSPESADPAAPTPVPQAPPEPAEPSEKPKKREADAPRAPKPTSAPAPAKQESTTAVQFVTEPPGVSLILDGGATPGCRTPCMIQLSAGRHSLDVHTEGYRPYPRVFNVPQERELFLQLTKVSGTLSLTSNPAGATIEINGELQNKRTPAIFNFAPGTYKVRVAHNGASLDFDVQLKDGEFINKRVDF
jgi:hypothetical protein